MAVIDNLIEDIRFGLGDIIVAGITPRYSPEMLNRRIGNVLGLFNKQNSKLYSVETLPAEYQDFIVILVQILLCRWEAARNARKFKISLSNLNASINERVEQYLDVANSLVDDYNRLAIMTNGDISTIQKPDAEVEKPLPLIDDLQGILTLFDEDRATDVNKIKSVFTVSNSFPPADNNTEIIFVFTPKDILSNNCGWGLDVVINTSNNTGAFVADTVDNNDGSYKRVYKVSNTPEKLLFTASVGGIIVSQLRVNIGG